MSDVFHALADPTRRDLLDRLRDEGPRSITELASGVPMTRQAVTKHLRLLESAGLIVAEVRGRERVHALRGRPLEEVGAWLARYEAEWDDRLARLKDHLDGPRSGDRSERGEESDV